MKIRNAKKMSEAQAAELCQLYADLKHAAAPHFAKLLDFFRRMLEQGVNPSDQPATVIPKELADNLIRCGKIDDDAEGGTSLPFIYLHRGNPKSMRVDLSDMLLGGGVRVKPLDRRSITGV